MGCKLSTIEGWDWEGILWIAILGVVEIRCVESGWFKLPLEQKNNWRESKELWIGIPWGDEGTYSEWGGEFCNCVKQNP